MYRKKSTFYFKSSNKKIVFLFLLLNLIFFSSLLYSENNFYHKNTELLIKSQNNLSTSSILPNITDMQSFNQFDEITIKYNILFCNNSNFILKINDTIINFGMITNDNFNLTQNIDSTQIGIFKLDLYILNQSTPINLENLVIFNSLSIQVKNEVTNITFFIVLGSISAISIIFVFLAHKKILILKKSIQQFMKDPIFRKNYSELINSEVILTNTHLESILHDIKKIPSNIDLDIESLDNEEFLTNFRGIQLK